LDTGFLGIGEHVGNGGRGHNHQRVVDRLGQRTQRRKAPLPEHLRLSWIDERDPTAIAELAQVLEDLARPARTLGCAHDSKRLGLQRTYRRTD
jgi:hypothetical protein